MKFLLDTCTFLWCVSDDSELSNAVRAAVVDSGNEVFVSSASFWEISIKYGLGKLPLPEDPAAYLPRLRDESGFDFLNISEAEVCNVHRLPPIHRDPFDRILISQANCYGLQIVTNDKIIAQYPVRTFW